VHSTMRRTGADNYTWLVESRPLVVSVGRGIPDTDLEQHGLRGLECPLIKPGSESALDPRVLAGEAYRGRHSGNTEPQAPKAPGRSGQRDLVPLTEDVRTEKRQYAPTIVRVTLWDTHPSAASTAGPR